MKNKKIIVLAIFFVLVIFSIAGNVYALQGVIDGMSETGKMVSSEAFGGIINSVIQLIQVAGSGISLIVVTILGIKYMTASAQEKADIKKAATPIVIGCVLLFAAANIVGIIADVTAQALS